VRNSSDRKVTVADAKAAARNCNVAPGYAVRCWTILVRKLKPAVLSNPKIQYADVSLPSDDVLGLSIEAFSKLRNVGPDSIAIFTELRLLVGRW